jgi:superfamily II DNA/RNA helicase
MLRRDEALLGRLMKPRRPRAVVLCPTRELSEQVYFPCFQLNLDLSQPRALPLQFITINGF